MAKRLTVPAGFAHDGDVRNFSDGDIPGECLSPAGYAIERHPDAVLQATDGNAMSATFAIVTREKRPNRYGNMVQITAGKLGEGIRTEYWEQNPVVLYDHGISMYGGAGSIPYPIGMAQPLGGGKVDFKKASARMLSTCYFSQTLADAAVIFGLCDEKILRMSSIGYYPELVIAIKQKAQRELPEGVEDVSVERWRGVDIVQSELIEWSITPIGADRGALRQALERGSVNGHKFTAPVRQSLAQLAEKPKVWAPGVSSYPASATVKIGRNSVSFSGPVDAVSDWVKQNAVDTQPAHGTTSASETTPVATTPTAAAAPVTPATPAAPVVTGEQLAEAMATRPQVDTLAAIGDLVANQLGTLLDEKIKPIKERQAAIEQRLHTMTGKLD